MYLFYFFFVWWYWIYVLRIMDNILYSIVERENGRVGVWSLVVIVDIYNIFKNIFVVKNNLVVYESILSLEYIVSLI